MNLSRFHIDYQDSTLTIKNLSRLPFDLNFKARINKRLCNFRHLRRSYFLQVFSRSVAVQSVHHYLPGLQFFNKFNPSSAMLSVSTIDTLAVNRAAQKHSLQNEIAFEQFYILDSFLQ